MCTLEIIKKAHGQISSAINLVASEAWFSAEMKLPYVTDIFHRYCFDEKEGAMSKSLPKFLGREEMINLEAKCNELLRESMNAKYSSVKPISGLNMLLSTISCLTKKKERIMSLSPHHGGHAATKYVAERLGLVHEFLPFREDSFEIDTEALKEYMKEHQIKIIYIDLMNVVAPINISELRKCVGNRVIICYDASHVLGLIMGKQFQSPLEEGADIIIGTTHKTFPGPHKGVFLTNNKWYFQLFDLLNDMYISHHHVADIGALAMALEKMKDTINDYAQNTIRNANILAETLVSKGINVFEQNGEFTQTHQIWVLPDEMECSLTAESLAKYSIITNTILIPFIRKQGIRIGLQEVTSRGFNEEDVKKLGEIIADIITSKEMSTLSKSKLKELQEKLKISENNGIRQLMDYINETYNL